MNYEIEIEQEEDGRWIAEIPTLPESWPTVPQKPKLNQRWRQWPLRVIAERIEREKTTMSHVQFAVA